MAALKLVVTPAARHDLEEIYQYGCINWGVLRASRYVDQIGDKLWGLTENPNSGQERGELLPKLRSLVVDSHVIFYRFRSSRIEIIRILHCRQDPQLNIV
ncbi:MAG: type II toxin-antitoxin system RelE/ParE family toxin [Halioglobus sp.]